MGRKYLPPQPTSGSGERCELPSGVQGRTPAEIESDTLFKHHVMHLVRWDDTHVFAHGTAIC